MPSVETVDTVVHAFVYTLWVLAGTVFIGGAWWLQRTRPGRHRSAIPAVDTGHQPAHAKPARPSWWVRVGAALADGWREYAAAQALLRGAQPWT